MRFTRSRDNRRLIEARGGTYALVLSSRADGFVRIGQLGELRLQSGFYIYLGSALGPGGVRARLAHHLQPCTRPHWHIDYLRAHADLEEVWYCHDGLRLEHEWARHIEWREVRPCLSLDSGHRTAGANRTSTSLRDDRRTVLYKPSWVVPAVTCGCDCSGWLSLRITGNHRRSLARRVPDERIFILRSEGRHMSVQHISAITLRVSNMARAVAFHREVLGLKLL